MEELFDWGMGMGLDDLNYQDNLILIGAPSPESFDEVVLLSGETHTLGLGLENAPKFVVFEREVYANNNLEEIMMEEAFHEGIASVDG